MRGQEARAERKHFCRGSFKTLSSHPVGSRKVHIQFSISLPQNEKYLFTVQLADFGFVTQFWEKQKKHTNSFPYDEIMWHQVEPVVLKMLKRKKNLFKESI